MLMLESVVKGIMKLAKLQMSKWTHGFSGKPMKVK